MVYWLQKKPPRKLNRDKAKSRKSGGGGGMLLDGVGLIGAAVAVLVVFVGLKISQPPKKQAAYR